MTIVKPEAVNHRRMRIVPTRTFYLFAAFFILFCGLVIGFWFFGGHVFSILLQRSRDYTPPQFLTWLSLASTLSIATVFCILPFSLFRIVRQRSDVPFGWVVLCIAGFLFLCGITSVFGLLTIWFHGPLVIWGLIISRVTTALLAVATLLVLRALVPRILELPSRAEWLNLNNELLRAEASAEFQAVARPGSDDAVVDLTQRRLGQQHQELPGLILAPQQQAVDLIELHRCAAPPPTGMPASRCQPGPGRSS